jgi:hypothetical protein
MTLAQLRLWAINMFIAALLAILAIDALPQSPTSLRVMIQPLVLRAGIFQGPWNLFAPEPDRVNRRLRAEIEYREGTKAEWSAPIWRERSPGEMFLLHRRRCWWDRMVVPDYAAAWESTCRYLARQSLPAGVADVSGAKVRLIYHEAPVPPAEEKPWPSIRKSIPYDDGWILTTETLE